MFKGYVYVTRQPQHVRTQQAVYDVGFSFGPGLSTTNILHNFPAQCEIVLIQQIDSEYFTLQKMQISDTVEALCSRHPSGLCTFTTDPWVLRSIIHSITNKRDLVALSQISGSTKANNVLEYIYIVRLLDDPEFIK